jgi:hypothetical protein
MKPIGITASEYHEGCDDNSGICTHCREITNFGGVEPDAIGYECEECGENTVYGLEMALLEGLICFVEEEE